MTVHVLIVEDSSVLARLVETYLNASEIPFKYHTVSRLSHAFGYLGGQDVDVVLMDLGLPDSAGLESLARMQEHTASPIIVMSGDDDPETALGALRMGAQDYLTKGEFRAAELVRAVRYAMARVEAAETPDHHSKKRTGRADSSSADCDQLQRTERELRRRNAELSALNTLAGIVSQSLDLEKVLNDTLDAVLGLALFEGESGLVLLVNEEASQLSVVVHRGMPDNLICLKRPMPLDQCLCGRAVLEEKVIVSRCEYQEAAEASLHSALPAHLDVGVPLIAHDRVVGVLNLWLEPDRSIEEQDVKLLEAIAGQVALAVETIYRYEAERSQRILAEQSRNELLHNERLAATGRLTASLAHELSNPLQAIHNSLEMILSFSFSREEMLDYIRMADEEVERLVEMVNRILDFSRRPSDEFEVLDLNRVVKKVMSLSKKYLEHRHITLRESFNADIPPIEGNATTLAQVILNLIINGVEAMPNGGTLKVSTVYPNNEHVEICVSDSGVGIPEEQLQRIFEPFYSTKADGTGLGLSISQSIISQHRGEIKVMSEKGEGASFVVRLPVYRDAS